MTDTPAPRKKSQKRQRNKRISAPCTAEEFNDVAAKAAAAGMSQGAYARAVLIGSPGPRSQRRPPADAQLLRQVLAQLGRYGNNWNQVAYMINRERSAYKFQHQVADELAHLREVINLGLLALGKNPRPA
jgi:murein L,D-transpeptidase YcbB/YkuD